MSENKYVMDELWGTAVRVLSCDGKACAPHGERRGSPRSYNPAFNAGKSMEAERLNQIAGTVTDLRGRLAELRRYL